MAGRQYQWVRVKALTHEEKRDIAVVCDKLIAGVLKPRYLPAIQVTAFNYPIDIFGKWHGNKYSFITRFRSGFAENTGEEFNAGFARLDHLEQNFTETRFDVMWYRHTGRWWRLHASVTLEEALRQVGSGGVLRPPI